MDWAPRTFVKSGLAWLCAGAALGLAMAIEPAWIIYRPAHVHMNLLGFVAMIIFGVGYQILPRMMGYGLYSPRMAVAHWWLANLGLIAMVTGFFGRPGGAAWGSGLLVLGGFLETVGAWCFALNLFLSMNRRDSRGPVVGKRPLPLAG